MPKKGASQFRSYPNKQKPPKPQPKIPHAAFKTASDMARRLLAEEKKRQSQAKTQAYGRSKVRHN